MNAARARLRISMRFLLAFCSCIVLVCASTGEAQQPGRGGGGSGPGRQPPKKKKQGPGRQTGKILKFKLIEDSEDDDLIGELSIKGYDRKTPRRKIIVRRDDKLELRMGDHMLNLDDHPDILRKGLNCTAYWGVVDPEARRSRLFLQKLQFPSLAVVGKVHSIEDNVVILKARMADGRRWPDRQTKDRRRRRPSVSNRPQTERPRKLKLTLLDDVSIFLDSAGDEIDIDDFEVGQEIEADIVFGHPYGYVIKLREPEDPDAVSGGGRQPPRDRGPGGGPRGGPGGGPRP